MFAILSNQPEATFAQLENRYTSNSSICNLNKNIHLWFKNSYCILGRLIEPGSAKSELTSHLTLNPPCICLPNNAPSNALSLRRGAPTGVEPNQTVVDNYQRLGVQSFADMRDDFLYTLWDNNQQKLVLACSAFNSRTLFYCQIDNATLVSSDIQLLTLMCRPTVNQFALLGWLSGRPNPNQSMFSNIHQLAQGAVATISLSGKVHNESFWDINPDKQIHYQTDQEYQSHFFELLEQSVAARTGSHRKIFSQLSGGMDSTSITAMANQRVAQGQGELHTISHTYQQTKSCDERDNINSMIEKLALQYPHFVELDEYTSLSFSELYPTSLQSPGMVMSPKYHQEASIIKQAGANLLLTGNGGDEMCWGHSYAYRDRLVSGELSVIREVFASVKELDMPILRTLYNVLFKPIAPNALLTLLGKQPINNNYTPPWLTTRSVAMLDQQHLGRSNPFAGSSQWAKKARYEGLFYTSTYNSMRSYQAIGDQYGFEVQHPFFDKHIAEFSFAVPQKLHIRGQYPKYLLRKTMNDYLPESVCWNKSKTVFDQHFANLVRANQDELRELLSHPGLHDMGLVDNDTLLTNFERVVQDPNGSLNVDLLYAILTQSWYQTHIEN